MSDLIGSDPILMVSDPIRSDLASVTSYMIGYDSTSTILGPIKSDPPSRMSDPIGSDPISMISDPISLGLAPAAAAGIGLRSCPLAQWRLWIAIPSAPTPPGFGTGPGAARTPVGLRSVRRRVASRDPLRRAVRGWASDGALSASTISNIQSECVWNLKRGWHISKTHLRLFAASSSLCPPRSRRTLTPTICRRERRRKS